eukprot:12930653-Alexandrium_andersonii.AAC.1
MTSGRFSRGWRLSACKRRWPSSAPSCESERTSRWKGGRQPPRGEAGLPGQRRPGNLDIAKAPL